MEEAAVAGADSRDSKKLEPRAVHLVQSIMSERFALPVLHPFVALILWLLSAGTAIGGDPALELLPSAILGEAETREAILKMGPKILPLLEEALKTAGAADAPKINSLIVEIRRRETLKKVSFAIGLPKMALTLDFVNSREFKFALSARNLSDKELILWPFLSLEVLDEQGNTVKTSSRRGRYGLRVSDKSLLETVEFRKIAPKKRWSTLQDLQLYTLDPRWICGWKIPAPGTYTLVLTYDYKKAHAAKLCPAGFKKLKDPAQPWNKALELKHSVSVTMKVQ